MEQSPFSLRDLCDACLTRLAPRAQAEGWELLVLVYDDVPDQLLGDPLTLGETLTQRLSQVMDQASIGELVVRGQLELLLPGRCRFRLQISPAPRGAEGDLVIELPLAEEPLPGTPVADLTGISLAVLDPHPLAALALIHRLRRANAQVERFESRDRLLVRLERGALQPDGLLLGIPAGTAPGVAREWLEACRATADLPILVVLSSAQQGLAEALCQAGANSCLGRPFTGHTLVEAVRGLYAGAALLDCPQDRPRALEIVGGDAALAAELLQTLVSTLPADVAEIETLINARDWQGVRTRAHRLRGAASYCALTDLWAAAGVLEQTAPTEVLGIAAGLQALQRQTQRVLDYCARGS